MMYIIPWNKDLKTGIHIVDEQHINFIKHLNKFIIMCRADKKVDAAMEELEFVEDYLMYHLQAEETFQYESHYPKYLDHQADHKHLTFKVKEMSTILKASDFSEESIERFSEFINEWIMGHIMTADLEFAKYYNSLKESAIPNSGE